MNKNTKQITAYYNQSIANVVNADVLHPPAWSAFPTFFRFLFSFSTVGEDIPIGLVWC